MYDVIVIGARCAGAALALLLARGGLKVLVIDRTRFPSDTMSGHYIHPAGVSCLRRLGLLQRLEALGAPAQETVTVDFGPVALSGRPAPAADGTTTGFAPRRYLFDPMLAGAAAEAGAELWEGVTALGPLTEAGRVTGLRVATAQGRTLDLRARLVVGADGKRSRFAAAVGAAAYDRHPSTVCTYYAYWDGLKVRDTRLFVRENRFLIAAPTNDGLTFLGIDWPLQAFRRVRADIDGAYRAAVAEVPWLADRFTGARRVGRYIGTADLDGFFRTASGPGWALLGDAGYHKDPITAQGMTDALLHAELLAAAILEGLAGRRPLAAALTDFGRRRDALAAPMYALTNDLARLAPPSPEMADLVVALQGNKAETSRFLGVISGTVPVADYFAPDNLNRIMGNELAV
jgi:2-polyprenyl-6-methoxyphenol hydroxylase-like FAD-dependent oxidoreductase